jgi:HAD superfamily hydrolase (TIGR01457 family)
MATIPPPDLADRFDAFLFDLDGVLYRGSEPIPRAPEAVAAVRRAGKAVVFVTNNSSRTSEEVAQKLRGMGIEARGNEVMTSALATAELLAERAGARAFVIGERGIREALLDAGLEIVDGDPERADLVIVGIDRTADYARLKRAALLVQRGAELVATNPDATFPAPDGLWPGAGALLAALVAATGAVPLVVGKPHPPLLRSALRRAGGGRPLVIGDRLDTDVAGATGLGWSSLLVLTGVTREEDLEASAIRPTYVARDLGVLAGAAGG